MPVSKKRKKVATKKTTKKKTARVSSSRGKKINKKSQKKKTASLPKKRKTSSAVKKKTRKVISKKTASAKKTSPKEKTAPKKKDLKKLGKKDLKYFEKLLIDRKLSLIGDIKSISSNNLNTSRKDASGDLSSYSLHMADAATDNYDREFYLGLADEERELLRKIDEALMRIKNKTYGYCLESGAPINRKRLEVVPWAEYCIEIQTEHEKKERLMRR